MPRSTTHVIFSLLLVSLCSCGDNVWRKLPEEKDIVFGGTAKKPQESAYRPGQARDIQLNLTSSDAEAKEAKFKVVSWEVADGKQGTLDTSSLSLGTNTLHYTPQEPGTHELILKVAVEGEGNVQTIHCPIEAPAAEWKARGHADNAGNLTLTIADAPEVWHSEPWRIMSTTFSEGLQGRIEPMPTRLNHGDNHLNIMLDEAVLEEPHVLFTIQGPDGSQRDYRVDLTALCVAQLRSDMSALDRSLADRLLVVNDEHETETERLYPLQPETVTDPRVNREKNNEITERLNLMERDLEAYDRDLQRLEALEVQDPEHPNRQLPTFRRGKQRLQDAIASLKSAQVQLQQQCTTAHEALFKTLQNDEQEATNILLDDPRLDVNAENERRKTLLYIAVCKENIEVVRKIIERGADVNYIHKYKTTALHLAANNGLNEILRELLENRADANKQDSWGKTALHNAAQNGHEEVAISLMGTTNLSTQDANGDTAVHLAAMSGKSPTLIMLLENAMDINTQNIKGRTPLHIAAYHGHANTVAILLDHGADITIRDQENNTAFMLARNRPFMPSRVINLLENAMLNSTR